MGLNVTVKLQTHFSYHTTQHCCYQMQLACRRDTTPIPSILSYQDWQLLCFTTVSLNQH